MVNNQIFQGLGVINKFWNMYFCLLFAVLSSETCCKICGSIAPKLYMSRLQDVNNKIIKNQANFHENIIMIHLMNKKFTLLPLIIGKPRASQCFVTNSVNREFSQYPQLFGYFCLFYVPGIILFYPNGLCSTAKHWQVQITYIANFFRVGAC